MANDSDALKPAVSQLPARIETKDGVVCVSGESTNGPLTLEIRLSASSSSVVRQTTFPWELIESLAEELGLRSAVGPGAEVSESQERLGRPQGANAELFPV